MSGHVAIPKVSVVIPAFNSEATLPLTLDSALGQTLQDIEIICIDDASNDSSLNIMSRYSERDSRVRVIHRKVNRGEGASRNAGIDAAKGEYIFHLDSDDTIPASALTSLYRAAKTNNSDMVKGGFNYIDEAGNFEVASFGNPPSSIINTNLLQSGFLQQIPISHCSYLYKKSLLNSYNIRYRTDMVVGQDIVYLAHALSKAEKVTLLTEVVYNYHQTANSATRGKITEQIAIDALRTDEYVIEILEGLKLYDVAIRRLQNIWHYHIDNFWGPMAHNLDQAECSRVFDAFRALVQPYNIAPWEYETELHRIYLLTLLLEGNDKESIDFLKLAAGAHFPDDTQKEHVFLEYVSRRYPRDFATMFKIGKYLERLGRNSAARQKYDEALRLDPNYFWPWIHGAEVSIHMGQYTEAWRYLETAIDKLGSGSDRTQQLIRVKSAINSIRRRESRIAGWLRKWAKKGDKRFSSSL